MEDWPHAYDQCIDCERTRNLADLIVVNKEQHDFICLPCFAKNNTLKVANIDEIYAYQPTETSPDGLTWKQQCLLHEKTIKELQNRIIFLEQKLFVAVKKLDKYE